MTLKDIAIFKLRPLVSNFNAKLSAATENNSSSQLLCLVHENNDLFLRYTNYDCAPEERPEDSQGNRGSGQVTVKLLPWFHEQGKAIQDICFEPNNDRLLVLCDDNTLHVVPVLAIVQETAAHSSPSTTPTTDGSSSTIITSYVVPFVGPHECPNPRTCPNNFYRPSDVERSLKNTLSPTRTDGGSGSSGSNSGGSENSSNSRSSKKTSTNPSLTLDELYSKQSVDRLLSARDASSTYFNGGEGEGGSDESEGDSEAKSEAVQKQKNKQKQEEEMKNKNRSDGIVCPYPTAVIWWLTKRGQDRAIVGYSDGSVCFLSLTPNCPFIANTTLPEAVNSFDICRDTSGLTVTLLINTASKSQWKLLLEEEQSRYIFPGDSPTTVADTALSGRFGDAATTNKIEQDWQFVVTAPSTPQISISSSPSANGSNSPRNDGIVPKLFPGGISYLREIGTRKIGALKQRLSAVDRKDSGDHEERRPKNSHEDHQPRRPGMTCSDDDDGDWGEDPTIATTFVDVLETPSVSPEKITSANGPRIVVKNHNQRKSLFALNSNSSTGQETTVSVHNLNMDPEPFFVYNLPEKTEDILVTQNTIYTIQRVTAGQRNGRVGSDGVAEEVVETGDQSPGDQQVMACGVVSRTLAKKNKESDQFQDRALVTYFPFHSENVINIHGHFVRTWTGAGVGGGAQGPSVRNINRREMSPPTTDSSQTESSSRKLTVKDYVKQRGQYSGGDPDQIGPDSEGNPNGGGSSGGSNGNGVRILEPSFPQIDFESCFVVTDRNTYAVELNDAPEVIFMNYARQSMWSSCKYFCDIFNISMLQAIEYVGDELLRQHKVTQALVTYNVVATPPIKTALKLATYGESNALLHLCAMALKCIYVLRSTRPSGPHAKALMEDLQLRTIPQKCGGSAATKKKKPTTAAEMGDLNSGLRCSDFSYDHDEVGQDGQMNFSAQFHLSNLLFLTLCERTLADKNLHPLWSFVQSNHRFHTSLASTILSQGGLYSTSVLLAKVRGAGLDVFMALVKAIRGEVGTDINYLMYNLSESSLFREGITYLSSVAIEYFVAVSNQRERLSVHVVDRLIAQLNPFAPCYRPIMSRLSAIRHETTVSPDGQNHQEMFSVYCHTFVEAFLGMLVRRVEMQEGSRSSLVNGLRSINVRYEANVEVLREERERQWQRVATGYAHACRVVNGKAFIWGSNQIPYVVDDQGMAPSIDSSSLGNKPKQIKFLSNLSITVLSVHCGRTHTLLYTNNGMYAMGGNSLGQLGIGDHISQALHPMLVETLMDKKLDQIAVGQYHNAVVSHGQLYVWGWGVYGQLGNGRIEDIHVPTVLPFFNGKKIKQIALGHVHSLVLCEGSSADSVEDLYVFGSNYFGQLGTGQTEQGEEKGLSKAMVPIRLDLNEKIRCIHTNFFVNFAVTDQNELLTWGASPQALRVINQTRKRARSQIRSEMAKEREAMEQQQQQSQTQGQETPEDSAESSLLNPLPRAGSEKRDTRPKLEAKKSRRHSLSNLTKIRANRRSPGRLQRSPSDESLPKRPTEPPPSLKRRSERSPDVSRESQAQETDPQKPSESTESLAKQLDSSELDEWTEHLRPTKVDTSNLEEEDILEVASGLYHFALRTQHGIYTWGKNIEKQLGNDSSRADVTIPTQLEPIKRPLSVHCGADFTLVAEESVAGVEEILLGFGNNNMGQCGRETGEKSALMGKWVRLKISKRHIRIPDGSACVSAPTEITFMGEDGVETEKGPRRRRCHQVATIKALPQFKRKYVGISEFLADFEREDREREREGDEKMDLEPEETENKRVIAEIMESALRSLKINGSADTSEAQTPEEEDEEEEEVEEWTGRNREKNQLKKSQKEADILEMRNGLPEKISSEFVHYCLSLFAGIYDPEDMAEACGFAEFRIRLKMLQSKFFEAFQIALRQVAEQKEDETVTEAEKIRQSIVLLEYFTKDENLIPMHEEDLKYFIQEIFVHFIGMDWDLDALEEYFQRQLSLYVIPLAYVLFFDVDAKQPELGLNGEGMVGMGGGGNGGNGSKQLRDSVLLKYRTFFNHLECAPVKYRVRGSAAIFERVSVVFNALICQRVVEIFEQVVDQ